MLKGLTINHPGGRHVEKKIQQQKFIQVNLLPGFLVNQRKKRSEGYRKKRLFTEIHTTPPPEDVWVAPIFSLQGVVQSARTHKITWAKKVKS